MLQVVQYQKDGKMEVAELPAPKCPEGGVLIQTYYSLISAGTEKISVANAQSGLLGRARKQPEQVKLVTSMIKKEGLMATAKKVMNKLDSYKSLGYSLSGIVIESDAAEFAVGDRVAAAGAGYANHAEYVAVPKNLVVKLPESVSFDDAAYTTLGAIAMQGFRQAAPKLGETVAVIGLGLLGQITVQLLKAAGCRVIGLDINESLFGLAQKFGCELTLPSSAASIETINAFTSGYGADAVIITASTNSNEPVELSMKICRKRGTVVVVGAVGMNIERSHFYMKEIDFKISCSYGPGRYDANYEERGIDYPFAFVRWTENRNMQAFLQLIGSGKVDVASITTHTFEIQDALKAYDIITGKTEEKHLGILLKYPQEKASPSNTVKIRTIEANSDLKLGFIGAGNFATNNLLPPLQRLVKDFVAVSTATPINAKSSAKRFGFAEATTDSFSIINDSRTNLIFIASRHNSHAQYVVKSLENDKNVFVEKPLAINFEQLSEIEKAYKNSKASLMVGFNRRFSKPFVKMKDFFANRQDPMLINYRINAGFIPKSHWIHDEGGRIIGEVCHFIDCMIYLTGALPISVFAQAISSGNDSVQNADNVIINIKLSDGSIGSISYLANGDSAVPKEFCEVFCEKKTAIMHDFTKLELFASGKVQSYTYDGKKGIGEELEATIGAIRAGKQMPISAEELFATTKCTLYAVESLKTGLPMLL